jgi:small subunit ribosomal protein S14
MAKTVDLIPKNPKFKVRRHSRCKQCGRSRGYYRKFELCRICFRLFPSVVTSPGSSSRVGSHD